MKSTMRDTVHFCRIAIQRTITTVMRNAARIEYVDNEGPDQTARIWALFVLIMTIYLH